jgi:thioredoxin 2
MKVVKLNVDSAPDIAGRYGVQGIPLLVLVQEGKEVDRRVGAVPEREIEAWLRPHLGVDASAPV